MAEFKIGDIVRNKTNGTFGVAVDIEPGKNAVIVVSGPEEKYRIKHINTEAITPPALDNVHTYGQFVKDRFVGMLVKIQGDKYLALCPDWKCYPKGKKYETGHWYKLAEIKPVTEEEKKEFFFKMSVRHAPEEYVERYELTKAQWRARGLEAEVKRFEAFFDRVLSQIGGKPGINWGARLNTVFAPDPTLNLTKNPEKDMQANMCCFLTLSTDVKTGKKYLSVYIKEWKWIPEAARVHFPRPGDGKFYPPGHCTAFELADMDDAALLRVADSLALIYQAANS